MLKGDLSSTTLASILLDLASEGASGALVLSHPDGEEAQISMRSGLVCGVHAPHRHSDLGAKLVSSGLLEPEALADALEAQRTDLSAWNLGELLVHLGYVDESVIQGFVTEQLYEALWDLMRWTEGSWKFRKNAKTREEGTPVAVVELLESLRERGYEWENIAEIVDSPNAVPMLSARGDGAPETTLDSDAWSMLCKIDGVRTVADLAADCGYTLFEAGQVLVALVDAGLVDISEDADDEDVYGSASALAGVLAAARNGSHDNGSGSNGAGNNGNNGSGDALSRLARLASDVSTAHVSAEAPTTPNPLQLDVMAAQLSGGANLTVPVSRKSGESFAAAMDRVAGALVDALGPAPEQIDNDPIVVPRRPKPLKRSDESLDLDEQRRRRRAAAAAELAQAQAAVESLRPDRKVDDPAPDSPPRLVDLEAERARVAAREAEEAARHATEGAAREAAEKFAREVAEQAARIQLEQAARESQVRAEEAARRTADEATDDEAHRLALAAEMAQREAAERAAEEALRLAAEQAAAEEAARVAAQQAERLAAERAAAEEAARVAAEELKAEQEARLAAEEAAREAAEEAARIAAEEAARIAAEEAAEEAARIAAEQAAAEAAARLADAQAEAERLAEEAAEREAAAEAERAAAAEAERLAAEAAEAERVAQEAAERQAAEAAEAARIAEEAEARAALAAAQAAADAQAEQARLAQEAAEQEAANLAAEEAERTALEDAIAASQRAGEAAAATAMLVELHNDDVAEPVEVAPAVVEPEPESPPAPAALRRGEDADTAALLRELSSLGLEDGGEQQSALSSSTPPRPRPTAPATDKKAKKKIGLFGL
jgi:hypothetical protein